MDIITDNPNATELNYAPPRIVSFGWIGEAFTLFTAKPGLWIAATLVAFVLPVLLLYLLDFLLGDPMQTFSGGTPTKMGQWVLSIGLLLVDLLVSSFFYGALFRMAVRQVRGLPVSARDILRGWRVFGPVTGFTLLYLLAVLGLELVCFAPALAETYLHFPSFTSAFTPGPNQPPPTSAFQTMFAVFGWFALGLVLFLISSLALVGLLLPGFALVADGERVGASFRRSVRAMKGQWLSAAALVFVMGLLVLVSEIPLLLGLLVTVPMVFLLPALAFRDMVGMPGMVIAAPPSYDPPQAGVWPPPPTVGQEYGTIAPNRAASPDGVEDKRI